MKRRVLQIGDRVVGHIMFSPMTVERAYAGFRATGLAPMSVLPEYQNKGIGSKLVRAGLDACKEAGYDAVLVLGHTKYYPRFGFARAKDYGLNNEYDAQEAFMVMELKPGRLEKISGLAKYAPEFTEAGAKQSIRRIIRGASGNHWKRQVLPAPV